MSRLLRWIAPLALLAAIPAARAHAQGYVVVVNASAGVGSMSKEDLSKVFLKKSTALAPVDQDKASAVRAAFSKAVLGRPTAAVGAYWQQQIFAGKDVPPPEKGSDADVLAFVKGNPKAIGYVAGGAALPDGVKAVTVQ